MPIENVNTLKEVRALYTQASMNFKHPLGLLVSNGKYTANADLVYEVNHGKTTGKVMDDLVVYLDNQNDDTVKISFLNVIRVGGEEKIVQHTLDFFALDVEGKGCIEVAHNYCAYECDKVTFYNKRPIPIMQTGYIEQFYLTIDGILMIMATKVSLATREMRYSLIKMSLFQDKYKFFLGDTNHSAAERALNNEICESAAKLAELLAKKYYTVPKVAQSATTGIIEFLKTLEGDLKGGCENETI